MRVIILPPVEVWPSGGHGEQDRCQPGSPAEAKPDWAEKRGLDPVSLPWNDPMRCPWPRIARDPSGVCLWGCRTA